ncbi:MAG: Uma2 family endonuclease [Isosphaeraceae bacterium]|nr:Uma2 family endonuclease [Isosphaeraceae bacterium]
MPIVTETPMAKEARAPFDPLFRLGVEQYLEMVRAGILTPDDRVELLEGILVAKMGKNPPHILATKRILRALAGALPAGWHVAEGDPIRTPDSVPEPDCAVLRGTDEDYRDRLPEPSDVALVVEVAETSLARDRGLKRRAYALPAIPTYWLANLVDRRIEVYTDPTGPADEPAYRAVAHFGPGDEVPLMLEGREIARLAVRDLLP